MWEGRDVTQSKLPCDTASQAVDTLREGWRCVIVALIVGMVMVFDVAVAAWT